MLYNIRASFAGVPKMGFDVILAITLFAKPPLVAGFMAFYWYTQLPDWGGELAVTFRDWDNIAR